MKLTRKQVFLGIGLAFVVLVVIVGIIGDTDDKAETTPLPTPTSVPVKTEELPTMNADQRKGFHCLSAWDGNHEGMEALIRDQLNDPGSMETVETRIAPVLGGKHLVQLECTAKNAFGGRVRHVAHGYVDNATCEAELTNIN